MALGEMNRQRDIDRAEGILSDESIHRQWVGGYRTPDNDLFYDEAFEFIFSHLENKPSKNLFLDIGCGSCAQSMRLAKRGYQVLGVDLSPAVLKLAERVLAEKGYNDQVSLQQQNLTELKLEEQSIDCILVWGVLMHVPEVEKAISEISRVLRVGGEVVVSEGNMRSVESIFFRGIRKIFGSKKIRYNETPAGMESWIQMPTGILLSRHARVEWLISEFNRHGLILKIRHPGQFTELYTKFSYSFVRRMIHGWNRFWFRHVRNSDLAYGNILIFKKIK